MPYFTALFGSFEFVILALRLCISKANCNVWTETRPYIRYGSDSRWT